MRAVPDFRKGEVVRAEDLAALVAAVRELEGLAQPLAVGAGSGGGGEMHFFEVAGSAVAVGGADGAAEAAVCELLWQVGPQVKLLAGGGCEGLAEKLAAAAADGAAVGLHASWQVDQVRVSAGYELAAKGVSYEAARWRDVPPAEDGSVGDEEWHGDGLAGCVTAEADAWAHRQVARQVWPLPQWPGIVMRQGFWVDGDGTNWALLPCPDFRQVAACVAGGYYPGWDYNAAFVPVMHCWKGRLDVHGQLHVRAENEILEI